MKKLIQNITLITLSFVVVFTTGGINIYKHYCFCTGETTQSFFEVGDQCNHTENHHCLNEPGQANQSHACCSVDKPENSENKGPAKRIIIVATTSILFLKQINMITQSQ